MEQTTQVTTEESKTDEVKFHPDKLGDLTNAVTALFKEHGLSSGYVTFEVGGMIFEIETGLTFSQKVGILEFAQKNIALRINAMVADSIDRAAQAQKRVRL